MRSFAPPDLGVVLCTYTEKRLPNLVEAIESLLRQTRPADEVVIVVDHNQDLLSRVGRVFPTLRILANQHAPGLSGSRNTGLASTHTAVIAFLDDDAIAAPDWLQRLEAWYQDPRVVGVGGAVQPLWEEERPAWFPPEFDWVVGCSYRGLPESAAEVRNLLGCNMSFRRHVFEQVGCFHNGLGRIGAYPVGCEETELCIRVQQAWPELTILYDPQTRVFHQVPADRGTWTYYRSRCFAEGISKAVVSRLVGRADGLAAERKHALRTLPARVASDLVAAVAHGDFSRVARAFAVVAGLGYASAGLLYGEWSQRNLDLLPLSQSRPLGESVSLGAQRMGCPPPRLEKGP